MTSGRDVRHSLKMPGSTRWIITRNNPGALIPTWDPATMEYMCWGRETAPTTGTPHWHAYVRYRTRKSYAAMRRLWGTGCDWKTCNENEERTRDYTRKSGGEWQEYGTFDPRAGTQGRRTDLEQATDMILKDKRTLREVALELPTCFVKFHSGLDRLVKLTKEPPPMERSIRVAILWGDTATGKTHRVRTTYPNAYSVVVGPTPFDDYEGEDVILFDEFRPDDFPITMMNKYLDKWPVTIHCRYANRKAAWSKVFICANSDPQDWYPNESYKLRDAFFRRLTISVHVRDILQQVDMLADEQPTEQQPPSPPPSPPAPKHLDQQPEPEPAAPMPRIPSPRWLFADFESPSLTDFEP